MADIIIKIPDEVVSFVNINGFIPQKYIRDVSKALLESTLLPKGHGRIADMDEAIKCIEDVEGEEAIWAISLIEWACSKRTIIEADAESEDKE